MKPQCGVSCTSWGHKPPQTELKTKTSQSYQTAIRGGGGGALKLPAGSAFLETPGRVCSLALPASRRASVPWFAARPPPPRPPVTGFLSDILPPSEPTPPPHLTIRMLSHSRPSFSPTCSGPCPVGAVDWRCTPDKEAAALAPTPAGLTSFGSGDSGCDRVRIGSP